MLTLFALMALAVNAQDPPLLFSPADKSTVPAGPFRIIMRSSGKKDRKGLVDTRVGDMATFTQSTSSLRRAFLSAPCASHMCDAMQLARLAHFEGSPRASVRFFSQLTTTSGFAFSQTIPPGKTPQCFA